MDEVNHVKMVVSFVLFCCAGLFLCLHDGYECSINVLICERIAKILFCKLLECFLALRYQGALHMVSERGYSSGAVGPSTDL